LFENLVIIELKRRDFDIFYHNEKKECDFVLREGNRIVRAIQACWSLSDPVTRKREQDGLLDALKCYDLKEGLILTEDEEGTEEIDGFKVQIMPVWKWLL
jgi:predicted AAA+ superfamily ATPase